MTTRVRRADNGRFATKSYGDRHPKTTINETVKPPKRPSGGGKKKS